MAGIVLLCRNACRSFVMTNSVRNMSLLNKLKSVKPIGIFETKAKPLLSNSNALKAVLRFSGHGREMPIRPTRYIWTHFWNEVHFFVMLSAVPLGLLILYCNLIVGPAELSDIPEDYEPRIEEYSRHPITRFLAKNFFENQQKRYEKFLQWVEEQVEAQDLRRRDLKFRELERITGDFKGWYFVPVNPAGVIRAYEERQIDEEMGDRIPR